MKSTFLPLLINAADRNRTGTGITTHGILSPGRLPVPPLRLIYMCTALIRTIRASTVSLANYHTYKRRKKHFLLWMEVDSNHRSNLQQIYSLSPLATRESIQICQCLSSSDKIEL